MAKKVGVSDRAKVAAAKPGQTSVIHLKGTAAYRDWLAAQSKRTHIPAASIVRLGLELWAKQNGVKSPPSR